MTDLSTTRPSAVEPAPSAAQHPEPGSLGPLALSLSGGGYRAAAFHLGALRLLDRAGLLKDVVGLSTVSGGSIVGMAWTVSLLDGVPFRDFDASFSAFLQRTNVIGLALDDLTSRRAEHQGEMPSLIRSAANVYADSALFGARRFGEVLDAPPERLQLQEAIFNSTEFHTGVDFRFRRSADPLAGSGNGAYRVGSEVARHIRLADIVAASSCFPGGFEPFVFPQQFHWPADFPLPSALQALGPKFGAPGLALMDGGIYDNQGVDSLVEVYDKTPAATLLISDVSLEQDNIYNVPAAPSRRGFLTLKRLLLAGWTVFLLALVSLGVLGMHAAAEHRAGQLTGLDVVVYGFVSVLMLVLAGGLAWGRKMARLAEKKSYDSVGVEAWPALRCLTVPEIISMAGLRVGSLLTLTSSIFMQRVRQLVYGHVLGNEKYKGKRMVNAIDVLACDQSDLYVAHPWLKPRPALLDGVNRAAKMGTTLWFDQTVQFGPLVDVGEASVCFVLLKHLIEDYPDHAIPGTPANNLFQTLKGEWSKLNAA
ncbi:patatin-like phospholipase family protein [Longimicrobium sp.]|jgi:predicted acylesterase/phospholipase RssA|uniref:patatin-like phospholipase family protein n=1 Tax=Longimicrobium sp. TaxID=2029185 RepID=UPI002F9212F3